MSANAGTAIAGSSAARPQADDNRGAADLPGRIFRQVTVLPALLAMAWLLAGLPLLLLGHFTPVLMLVVFLPLAAVLVTCGLRWISGPSQGLLAARGAAPAKTPWWAIVALLAVAVLFGFDQFAHHAQQVIVQRDPASYVQFGNWIARHGSLPIPQDAAAFGGYSRELSFNSPAFYQVGHSIVPQFMAGLPMTLAAAFWIGGISTATAAGTLLGSCGVLAMGGLVGRLVGPRWAPVGALALALSLPEQFTSRSTYSETLTQVLLIGGLCLVVDSISPDGTGRRKIAALGGLAIGLTLLVRIDGASDMLPLIPYAGILVLGRARQAWPLIAGVAVGLAYGAVDGLVLSRPYLTEIKGSLIPLVLLGAVLLVATMIVVVLRQRDGLPKLTTDRLPNAAAILAVLVTIGLVIRPYVQTVHGVKTKAQLAIMAKEQAAQHLPIQPTRMYYEISLHWVFWYLGIPAVILATVGAAVISRRCLRGNAPAWTLPLMCFAWIIVATLLRPSITPDQPWASRRLVPGVLPGFIVLGVWAVSWLAGSLRERGVRPVVTGVIATVLGVSLLWPAAQTSFGIKDKNGGPVGIRLTASGLAEKVTFRGEIAGVRRFCTAIPPGSSVLFVSDKVGREMTQVVRGMCGEPAAVAERLGRQRVLAVVAAIRRAGRRPVLMGASRANLLRYGSPHPVVALQLRYRGDTNTLEMPPLTTKAVTITVWMSEYSR